MICIPLSAKLILHLSLWHIECVIHSYMDINHTRHVHTHIPPFIPRLGQHMHEKMGGGGTDKWLSSHMVMLERAQWGSTYCCPFTSLFIFKWQLAVITCSHWHGKREGVGEHARAQWRPEETPCTLWRGTTSNRCGVGELCWYRLDVPCLPPNATRDQCTLRFDLVQVLLGSFKHITKATEANEPFSPPITNVNSVHSSILLVNICSRCLWSMLIHESI